MKNYNALWQSTSFNMTQKCVENKYFKNTKEKKVQVEFKPMSIKK